MLENLKNLVLILSKIYPTAETINPFYKIELSQYPTEYQYYYRLLTHYLTLIYKNQRPMEKAKYITSREDIVASLQLLEIVTLKKYRTQETQAQELWEILKNNTKENQILTSRNIREIANYSKSQTHRFIVILLAMNKLEKVSTHHKSIGHLFKIVASEEEKPMVENQSPKTKKETIFDGFDDFNDNQNIEYQYRKDNFRF
jgi:hypothetical protein